MVETLYEIEINQTPHAYVGKMRSRVKPQKPVREYKSNSFEEILEQIVRDILDENED